MGGTVGEAFQFAVIVFFFSGGGSRSCAGFDGFIGNRDVVRRRGTEEMQLERRGDEGGGGGWGGGGSGGGEERGMEEGSGVAAEVAGEAARLSVGVVLGAAAVITLI